MDEHRHYCEKCQDFWSHAEEDCPYEGDCLCPDHYEVPSRSGSREEPDEE